jgi:hypothetical protein
MQVSYRNKNSPVLRLPFVQFTPKMKSLFQRFANIAKSPTLEESGSQLEVRGRATLTLLLLLEK